MLFSICSHRYSDATKKKARWAIKVFEDWQLQRNGCAMDDVSVDMIPGHFLTMSPERMRSALGFFILEVRKKNGDYYPSDTLYELIISLQIYLHIYGCYLKFLDDPYFVSLRNGLDNRMKFLASQGYYCCRQKAEAIDAEDEMDMWEKGILGDSNPQQLLETVLYMLGVHFALRAGKEHRALRLGDRSQFMVRFDKGANLFYLEYTEDTSKNNQGGLKHRKIQNKVARAYENRESPEKCVVKLYRKYISLRPSENPKCPDDFYLQPLTDPTDSCWYSTQPLGINKLGSIVARLASQLGLQGKITNHSCRATSAMRMFQNNVEEQLVMERTGHRSNAVRSYKRTSDRQLRNLSCILYGQSSKEPPAKKVCVEDKSTLAVKLVPEAQGKPDVVCNVQQVDHADLDNVTTQQTAGTIALNLTINLNNAMLLYC